MNGKTMIVAGITVSVLDFPAVVVGSGAAGLAAAMRLEKGGLCRTALLTESFQAGTSRNTGSDKQTYYKLSLAGDMPDSITELADTLFQGGCMDGDLARIEAALSADCFHWLCDLGVPFPRNQYGEAVGYKTDHDPKCRATSAGPLTSRWMVECLEKALQKTSIQILDGWQVIRLLTDAEGREIRGLLCLNRQNPTERADRYLIVRSRRVIFAVGGPAMLYADSVYPASQMGASGLALEAGVRGKNLTEWQYGLASLKPRWNVSGSYQQVLPRYFSTDQAGGDCREFLEECLPDETQRLGAVFRKGYEWPFDVRKIAGSSLIDLLVYQETILRNRRVFLDYQVNPGQKPICLDKLDSETADFWHRAGINQETPFQRLLHLNQPAVDFYRSQGVDLAREPLEIRLCAQHHNGGLAGDGWWQSNLAGFYPIGEVNGSHGVYRPGGSALNSGQVGALRAARHICSEWRADSARLDDRELQNCWIEPEFEPAICRQIEEKVSWVENRLSPDRPLFPLAEAWKRAVRRMSRAAGAFRAIEHLEAAERENSEELAAVDRTLYVAAAGQLSMACRYRELLQTERYYLAAMLDYVRRGGVSRGSALYLDPAGQLPASGLPEWSRCRLPRAGRPDHADEIQELDTAAGEIKFTWRPVHPLPRPDDVFEQVWRECRANSPNTLGSSR
ncbi:MAG: FAD-binding protein [Clostridiaceae bacterium]|nr:FAD-binding protein [Clostridiaceae bacterium]